MMIAMVMMMTMTDENYDHHDDLHDDDDEDEGDDMHSNAMQVHPASQTKAQDQSQKPMLCSKIHCTEVLHCNPCTVSIEFS